MRDGAAGQLLDDAEQRVKTGTDIVRDKAARGERLARLPQKRRSWKEHTVLPQARSWYCPAARRRPHPRSRAGISNPSRAGTFQSSAIWRTMTKPARR